MRDGGDRERERGMIERERGGVIEREGGVVMQRERGVIERGGLYRAGGHLQSERLG
jgi:hypothetical protein